MVPCFILLFAVVVRVNGLSVSTVQRSATYTLNPTDTDVTIAMFDTVESTKEWQTGAFLDFAVRQIEGRPGAGQITCDSVNETHVRIRRNATADQTAIVVAQQVRLAPRADAIVTRWQGFYPDAPTARPGADDGDLSLLFASVRQEGGTWGGDDQPLFEFSPTNLTILAGNPGTQFFALQWLSFPSSSGTEHLFSDNRGSDRHGDTDFPVSVGQDVDWTRSVLRYSSWNDGNNAPREWLFAIKSFDSQGVTFEREFASYSDTRLSGQIIEFTDGTAVQHITQDFTDGATSRTYTLQTAVPSDRTVVLSHNILGRGASSRQYSEDNFGYAMFTGELDDCAVVGGVELCDSVSIVRRAASAGDARCTVMMQVVTFPTVTEAPTPSPTVQPTPSPTVLTSSTLAGSTSGSGSPGASSPAGTSTTEVQASTDDGVVSSVDGKSEDKDEDGGSIVGLVVALVVVLLLCLLLLAFVVRKRRHNATLTASERIGPTLPVGPTGPSNRFAAGAVTLDEPQGEYGSIASLRDANDTYETADSVLGGEMPGTTYGTVDDVRTSQITYGSLPNVQHSDTQGMYAAAPKQR